MVHRGGLESSTEKNKKDDFNSCIAENAKTADHDVISNNKIEQSAPKSKQLKKSAKKIATNKSTTLPLSDHSITQTVVRLERSRLIKAKSNQNSKITTTTISTADTNSGNSKSKRPSPVRVGLRSSSLESHTSTTSNNNNAKTKKKKPNAKKANSTTKVDTTVVVECPLKKKQQPQTTKAKTLKNVENDDANDDDDDEDENDLVVKNAAQKPKKLSKQLPLSFICSLPLNRLSGILEKLKSDKTTTKCPPLVIDEDTCSAEGGKSNQSKTLCLYCDKRMSTVKVRSRHIERFHTISKERRSSSRNPIPSSSSQDSKDVTQSCPATTSSSSFSATTTAMSSSSSSSSTATGNSYLSGCSYCSKSAKLQAVALENDLNALFFHLVDFHSDKYFGCKVCAIRFQTAAKLNDHVQRMHSATINKNSEDVKTLPESKSIEDDIGKSTPTKTRRQIKQVMMMSGGDVSSSTQTTTTATTTTATTATIPQLAAASQGTAAAAAAASSSASSSSTSNINRNGSMFSNEEPILSRLGLTQNRLPRGRKGIRSRRQTNVDTVKPDTSLITVKTRSKLGRFSTSNEPIETVFRTPTNTRIEPLSCTFDEDFYEKVFTNVRTNLSCHLDGKISTTDDTNRRPQSPPPLMPAIRSTVVKSSQQTTTASESEVHTATSLAALTAFPTLLTAEQYGCDFGTAKIKRPITRHSWKWKWDSVKKYKYVNEGGKIVKKIKQPMLGLRDLSKLDMWTQLTMRQKHEVVRKQSTDPTNNQCLVEYNADTGREEKQRQVDQLNSILDSRRLPQIILEQNEQTIIKIELTDEGFHCLASEVTTSASSPTHQLIDGPSTSSGSASMTMDRIIPANLNLIPRRSLGDTFNRQSVVLSGEWARPRCYVCFGCGARFDKRKALEEHKMFRHPHVYSTHYEIVGRELIEGNLYKHFFIPLKALSRHREYAQRRILVNKKTDYNVSKSSSNSGNEEESLDSLHSVTASFTTLSSSKLSDDCDTDTKTAIENNSSSFAIAEEVSQTLSSPIGLLTKTSTTALASTSSSSGASSMDCTKCNRNCHGMLELYRHMLDCSGDYAWILAKKKKYRYYGSRKRRQINRQNISALHLHRRKVKMSKDENESDETPKKKYMSPSTPRPRASDADSIRKMLENLPPKRVCREIIPNATKPRSRKFKTTGKNSINKCCKTSNTTLTAISKKILRNHKLRAMNEKDKITRNKQILQKARRKSARVRNRVIATSSKNVHSQNNKANKKTDATGGGRRNQLVRKIGATTKRFVKKIKKRLLGGDDKDKTTKPSEEDKKQSSKLSAVRKLTFDKEQENLNQDKTLAEKVVVVEDGEEKNKSPAANKEKSSPEPSAPAIVDCKTNDIPTITIDTSFETKKLEDTSANEELSLSLRSEGSTENLNEQQSDFSVSTEDLNRLNPNFLHNQVSPTTKRRSKKINDCIAMLTGKIQEKLGKPFLECKESQNGAKAQNAAEAKAKQVLPSPEIVVKETKPTKRKAPTRKIVKCDQTPEGNIEVVAPAVEEVSIKEVLPVSSLAKIEPASPIVTKRTSTKQQEMAPPKKSVEKESQKNGNTVLPTVLPEKQITKAATSKGTAKILPEKTVTPVKETPVKETSVKETPVKETPVKVIPVTSPIVKEAPKLPPEVQPPSLVEPKPNEIHLMKPPAKDHPAPLPPPANNNKESYLMESLLRKTPLKNLPKELQIHNLIAEQPFKPHFEELPSNSNQQLPKKDKSMPNRRNTTFPGPLYSTNNPPQQLLPVPFSTDLRQELPSPFTNFKPIPLPVNRVPPPPVTIEIVTPAPVLLNDIVPKKLTHQSKPPIQQQQQQQQNLINAETIRVPYVKPPQPTQQQQQQLSVPQFMPVQQQQQQAQPPPLPTPRALISKRRQTIACAPNDFLYEMNSLRCANAYNNLPFELEVPLDLSKKSKRASPKAKTPSVTKATPPPAHTQPQSQPPPPPVHFPQISVKPNAVLMPPVPYQLPLLPQTSIIPILCESLLPNLPPQIALQSPPQLTGGFPAKEIVTKPTTTSTPRKRTTNNNKKQDVVVSIVPQQMTTLPNETAPPKKVSKKATAAPPLADDKLKPNVSLLPVVQKPKEPMHPVSIIEAHIRTTIPDKAKPVESKAVSPVVAIPPPSIPMRPITISLEEAPKTTAPSSNFPIQSQLVNVGIPTPLLPEASKLELPIVEAKETKKKTNKKSVPLTTPKKVSPVPPIPIPAPPTSSIPAPPTVSNQVTQSITESLDKNEINKNTSSPSDSLKPVPTRRSRRNKASTEPNEVKKSVDSKKPAIPNDVAIPPPAAIKEVEAIAASFVSDDEPEVENVVQLPAQKIAPEPLEQFKEPQEEPKTTNNEIIVTPEISIATEEPSNPISTITPTTNNTEIEQPPSNKQDSGKKPRRRRKNELASIVADQLMESFKETDKARIDDLKRLEELAYEKSEDLLLTGMRLMPTTKRKNVLENKKDLIAAEIDAKIVNSVVKETKKPKADTAKEKPPSAASSEQKEDADSKQKPEKEKENAEKTQKQLPETKSKNQIEPSPTTTPKPLQQAKEVDSKPRPPPIDFRNYRSNSMDSWSHRDSKHANAAEQDSPINDDKSPTSDTMPLAGFKDKKNKKKQTKKRDKKIEIDNINLLRTGLESFTLSKDIVDNNAAASDTARPAEQQQPLSSIVGLFSPIQAAAPAVSDKETSAFGNFVSGGNKNAATSILRPSILAASMDITVPPSKEGQQINARISRDPRLNKNIHTEEGGEQLNVQPLPETTSRLATLRTRRKSFADATPPTYTSRANSRSTPIKRPTSSNSRRNSLAFDDDEDDNYLTAIAKRVNDKIMSAEDKDFNLANDGFELANSFINNQDDPYERPSTSMSVRSAPNFNEDRSNMDTMDATNTDIIDMDVDDDMSVYTTFSQDTTRSKSGRRRRRRRSILLTRKPKKTNVNLLDSMETFDCLLCNKKFAKAVALNKHQLTIAHVSKVSEQEYLNAQRKQNEEKEEAANNKKQQEEEQRQQKEQQQQQKPSSPPKDVVPSSPAAKTNQIPIAASPKQYFNAIQNINHNSCPPTPRTTSDLHEKSPFIIHKPQQPKVPFIPPNSILNQAGIEPISSPEQNYERYSTKTSSRLTLNPDERLFYECCNILKGSETPLVERTYPIVPPTTYAYDLQVKPVTPKSPNERFSYMKPSSGADTNGKREASAAGYPRLDVNQFSDISSDSNPACAQPPPVLPVNYAQMHVLAGAKDQPFLTTNDGQAGVVAAAGAAAQRSSSILQMASIITPAPLTARTFVNQPSQIGTHLHHGMDGSAVVGGQKQNFISPLHSASSQSSTITTTTSRLKTKAAMKGYDNLKVSIPTIGLDMEHALERSPRPGCKLTTLADIALGNEPPHTTFTPSLPVHNEQKSKSKQKPTPTNNDIAEHFPTILQSTQPKENQMVSPPCKKRELSPPIKEPSLVISVHDTESCMPIALSSPKKPESIIAKDIYEFDDSENTPISKAIQSPFKIADGNDSAPKKAIIIPERPFKNIGMEEKEAIKFQKPETPAINDENTSSTVSYSDRDDFVYGSMSGGDDDNDNDDNENDNDCNKEPHVESDESSNSSAFTAKTFENKSLIMGRIFKNAKTKPKMPIEKPVLPAPEPPKQIPKQELDRLFDTLRGGNDNRQLAKEDRQENMVMNVTTAAASRKKQNQSTTATKKKVGAAAAEKRETKSKQPPMPAINQTEKEKPTNKRAAKKSEQNKSKEMSQLHAELGMSPAEIAELIGEGQRKSQRRCAVNRPKKLVEIWSSDEFEEFLSTKDIIALIEEKEQKTKKKRKTASTPARKHSKGNKKDADEQSLTQSDDEKSESAPASPQKKLKNNTAETAKAAKAGKTAKTTKSSKKETVAAAPVPKVTARAQRDTTKTTKNSTESTKTNNNNNSSSSPFKKPTQRNIISKLAAANAAAEDSESDFEAELKRRTKTAPQIRNRRKTISGKLENDAGSSSSSSAKKVSGKSKTDKSDARNSSTNNSKTKTSSTSSSSSQLQSQPQSQSALADSTSQSRPQARRKRIASEMLYYWSSSSDEEFGRIESPHDDEHHIDESENYQQHGWIVGDSHKKLVTLLAIAKGNKKVDDCGVKETSSKKKS